MFVSVTKLERESDKERGKKKCVKRVTSKPNTKDGALALSYRHV